MIVKIPTLVAPGGSHTKALVASAYGAEEVYVGVPFTSLRMRQNKLYSFDMLQDTVDQLHANGTKALLTMNIFPRNSDIQIFESVVEKIADLKPDGIIFSDPGTFSTIRKYLPDTPLHLSTQTTTLNYAGVKFWADLGVKRIVLARELNIKEIEVMKKEVPEMELECFVHGAMCMSYSGRCLLGDYLGGRAGNRGECNHACRFKYKVFIEEERRNGKLMEVTSDEDGEHILSSRDLCTIERLNEILPFVDAMKIEGRSKSEFYVGAITKAYKHVRDCLMNGTKIDPDVMNLVNVVPHREYWSGFLLNDLKDYVDGEVVQTTGNTAGPLFARNFYGMFSPEVMERGGNTYHHINPKEDMRRGMKLKFISPDEIGELEIIDILDKNGKKLEKADCNMVDVFVQTTKDLKGWECVYVDPKI
ncbi:peptidase U32 [candidate division SR1 bacterium]|nr:peptidase U32 [candidate division SR1 bacterium]